uniref:Oryzain gamma chain n=1 Tax=Oryza coarctata TaxID=77588 RepID=A0A8K0YC04_ORYCO|nr:oryzain gamma chain precursor [Oryza coarctata]
MAHRRLILLAVLALSATAAVDASDFDDSNPIRSVTDHAASALESTVLAALGRTRDALRFARFAVRHGRGTTTRRRCRGGSGSSPRASSSSAPPTGGSSHTASASTVSRT